MALQDLKDQAAAGASALGQAFAVSLDEAFALGVASVGGPDLTPFSQADLDKAVADAVAPLQVQIDSIPSQLEALKVSLKASVLDLVKSEEVDMEGKLASL